MTYLVKVRRHTGALLHLYVMADSAVEAVEIAERHTKGLARSVWPLDWQS